MQPSNSTIDLERLLQIWLEFTSSGRLADDLDPLIRLSWQRCAPRLNPTGAPQHTYVSSEVLPLTLNRHAALRAIARPIMEDIHQFIEGSGAALALLDNTTCVLDTLGDRCALEKAASLGIRQGAFLSESRLGTNAFALALIEGCPAQVIGAEHFLIAYHDICSAAAPIHNVDGHPVGVIGLFSLVTQHGPHMLGIAVAAAKSIENQLQAELFVQQVNTRDSELNATLDAISDGVLAWTAHGTIMHLNSHAGQMLGLTPTSVVGRPLAEHITLPESLARAIARGEEFGDVDVSFDIDGQPREYLVSLRMIRDADAQPTAYIATLRRIEQVRQLVHQQVGAQARLTLGDLAGSSAASARVRRQALAAADAKACVLLLGEAGTGKNVLARAIHNSGTRADGPFLAINCRAIPREIAVSELLGHEADAFGTASAGRPSKFELAHGGTLLLDEIESLSLDAQAALLRVIESGEVIRLGGARLIGVDVRVIATSDAQLEAHVSAGTFRSDLLFRLRSFAINVAPLRERREDIPLLLERLLKQLSVQIGHTLTLTPAANAALCAYPWPGNVRELESVMERAALLCEDSAIEAAHLPETIRQRQAKVFGKPLTEPVRSMIEAERLAILSAGRATSGNLTEAARLLGIGRTTLWRKIKEHGIILEDFKHPVN
jgi:transcriptional activator for dhaKLM operon